MSLLIPLGLIGIQQNLMPIFTAILILLTILYFSYRQTIAAYPNGGGSFTVASENLGDNAGLLAAAALMIDYILTAAVGISAGVTALVSAVPSLHPHQLALCLVIACHHRDRQLARCEGIGIRFHASDISVCRHPPCHGGHRYLALGFGARSSHAGFCAASAYSRNHEVSNRLASSQSLCQRILQR